jgi:predicted PurR-regulated permease PerM
MFMNVRIEIETRTFVRFWLVVIGFALAVFALYSIRTVLIIVGLSFFLAIALSPPVNRLAKILPGKSRVPGTALAYVAVLAILGAIIFLVVPPITEQMVKFAQNVPSLVDSATQKYAGVNDFVNHYKLQPQVNAVLGSVKDSAAKVASGVGSFLVTGIGSVLFMIVTGILVLVLTFLMLVEGPMWLDRLWSIYNNQERMEYHRQLLNRMYRVTTNFVVGQLSVSAIAGSVAGLATFILSLVFNIPMNLVIPVATIIFTLSLVPMFGAMTGAILVSIVLALNNISAAIIFIVFFILYQQVEANFISPKIQSKRLNLSALVILIAVTTGFYMFGIVGGIISIPIAGCIGILIEDYFARNKKKVPQNKKPINKILGKLSMVEVKVKD